MLRSGASRQLFRSLNATSSVTLKASARSQLATHALRRPAAVAAARPLMLQQQLRAFADARKEVDQINLEAEHKASEKTLKPHPELVSTSSSTHPITSEVGVENEEKDVDMMAGIKHDLQTIRDTFSLQDVPKEAYYIGMAGVLPYLATSLSTVYCAWEINHTTLHGAGFLLSEKTAELLLHILEPLQVGYGATIISFLGAIHWGLEFAGYGGYQGYKRYAIGVVAPAIAWPTVLLPVEYALITQFLAFNFLYYADSRATKRGWCPSWYGVYRFVLTFIVGGSIVASLIGRGQIADRIGQLPGPADRIRALRESQLASLEEEEEAKRKSLAEEEEEEE
ncbi:hypothetical protein K431DRAFT_286035 [Polychaeton citri CBS 116435]|uniref:Uncharacterized protein n=1 Tax=Polychaeton citri CBS 116435 TaxID=1314669 RepID=A0A9P4UNW0_9PEZI|nr:hypothetical protein K431DRAFT_286035 [Polychaeton citri CBS 116435]